MKAKGTVSSPKRSYQSRVGGRGAATPPDWLGQRPQEAGERQSSCQQWGRRGWGGC